VLLQLGANWCLGCHELHAFLQREQNVAEALRRDYVVVMIDVNKEHNRSICLKYGQPHVLPTIIVLEDDGKMLTASDSEKWNEGHRYSPEKMLAFLNEWAPKK
jgi:thiol:disulfide interchange protein